MSRNISNLLDLEISPKHSDYALSISNDKGFQLLLKTQPNACFINNYFRCVLFA